MYFANEAGNQLVTPTAVHCCNLGVNNNDIVYPPNTACTVYVHMEVIGEIPSSLDDSVQKEF